MTPQDLTSDFVIADGSQLQLQTTGAVPPVQSYVSQNAIIQIQTWNAVAGQVVSVGAQILLPDGTLTLSEWDITPLSDRSRQFKNFGLAEGFLISLSVTGALGVTGNRTFVAVRLQSSSGGGRIVTVALCQGYIGTQRALAWPPGIYQDPADGPGAIVSVTGTTPGAGAEISETVPSNAIWRIKSFWFKLTTSATVANRIPHLIIDDGTNVLLDMPCTTAQTAGQVITYVAADGVSGVGPTDNVSEIRFPFDLRLMTGSRIRTLTTAIQAGDQYTAPQYLEVEWLFT